MQQLRHYSLVLRHWFWLLCIGMLVCGGATFAISKFVLKPAYQATSMIQVNGPLSPTTTSGGNDVFSDQALAVGYSLLITSNDTLQMVAHQVPGTNLSQLKQMVSASQKASSQIIEVRAQAGNPQLAADIANTVVTVFIQMQVDKVTAPLKKQDSKLAQNLLTVKANISQIQAQLSSMQRSGAAADTIVHQNSLLTTAQANYNSLLTSQQQIELQMTKSDNALSIAQTAIPPDQVSSPHTSLNTVTAAALGLLLMLVLALLLDWLDVSIQTPEDVAHLAQLEPLGSVPLSKSVTLSVGMGNTISASDEMIEQTFTAMVMSNTLSILHKGEYAVMVTSLSAGAGVTMSAANLAITLARSGKRVLLVDANLHRPVLHDVFHCPNTGGLASGLIDGYQSRNGIIQWPLNFCATGTPNLWFLPAGSTATQPALTHHLPTLRLLTNWLLGRTQQGIPGMSAADALEIVIFDASALSEGADAVALASVTDYSVLVVDAGKERSEVVKRADVTLQKLGSPVLGVIVNRQTARHRPYFYTGNRFNMPALSDSPSLEEVVARASSMQVASSRISLNSSQVVRSGSLIEQAQPLSDIRTLSTIEAVSPSTFSSPN